MQRTLIHRVEADGLKRYVLYVFDYGAPTRGFHSERTAQSADSGNAIIAPA
jgi:hypothetical protein